MSEETAARDLHAGDWVECPEGKTGGCWIAARRVEGERINFLLGRGGGHAHLDRLHLRPSETMKLLHRWPEVPAGATR